ncbi:MAG: phage Cindaradix [Actinomycetota bacterium]
MSAAVIDITSVGRATVTVHGHIYKLSPVERQLLTKLGGSPWTIGQATPEVIAEANDMWTTLSRAAGYASASRWFTDHITSPKLGKAGVPTVGFTLHAARSAADAWKASAPEFRHAVATALGRSEADVAIALDVTFCPKATLGCIAGCVTNHSYHASLTQTQQTRLLRDVFMMMRPDLALALTADQIRRTVAKAGGKDKARWRVNISDDIRWEVIAPGLLDVAPLGYTYTKWLPAERPAVGGLSIVYSANERWTDGDIAEACNTGHRVAVVFDVPKGKLPTTWNQIDVVDGDSTDDLYEHPAGTIVALAVKGRTADIKEEMARTGFARAA